MDYPFPDSESLAWTIGTQAEERCVNIESDFDPLGKKIQNLL